MQTRRQILLASAAWLAAGEAAAASETLEALEASAGGRLGVAALDTASERTLSHRGDERFAMCSTFKLPLVAAILDRADRGGLALDERIPVLASDLVPYAPATEPRVDGRPMTIEALCEAAMVLSDNVAANLLLARIGGPPGWTDFVRTHGDDTSRLDRIEPELNTNLPGDARDTTTPAAMCALLRTLVLADALSPRSRARLARWMRRCRTGDARLRAGFPSDWQLGDKTGTSSNGAANDVAIAWRRGRAPIVVAAYYDRADATPTEGSAVLADAGRIVALTLTGA